MRSVSQRPNLRHLCEPLETVGFTNKSTTCCVYKICMQQMDVIMFGLYRGVVCQADGTASLKTRFLSPQENDVRSACFTTAIYSRRHVI